MCVNLLVIIAVRFSPTAASVAFLRPVSTEVTTGLIEGAPLTPSVVAFPTFRSAFEVAFTFGIVFCFTLLVVLAYAPGYTAVTGKPILLLMPPLLLTSLPL